MLQHVTEMCQIMIYTWDNDQALMSHVTQETKLSSFNVNYKFKVAKHGIRLLNFMNNHVHSMRFVLRRSHWVNLSESQKVMPLQQLMFFEVLSGLLQQTIIFLL